MKKKIFVVTNPESGWDCVRGVYEAESEEQLKKWLLKDDGYEEEPENWEYTHCIHEQYHGIEKVK